MTIINLQGINITPPYLQHNREPLSTFDPRPNVVCTLYLMQWLHWPLMLETTLPNAHPTEKQIHACTTYLHPVTL